MTTTIDPWLREILRCPACRSSLEDGLAPQGGPELVCTGSGCGLAYRVEDGVPVLLVEEARRASGGTGVDDADDPAAGPGAGSAAGS